MVHIATNAPTGEGPENDNLSNFKKKKKNQCIRVGNECNKEEFGRSNDAVVDGRNAKKERTVDGGGRLKIGDVALRGTVMFYDTVGVYKTHGKLQYKIKFNTVSDSS